MKLGVPGRVPKNCSTGPIILIVGLSKGCDTWEGWPESVKESAERESSRRGTGDLHPPVRIQPLAVAPLPTVLPCHVSNR